MPLDDLEAEALDRWELYARDEQLEPPGDWRVWYLRGGRGSGKTRTGAETLAGWIAGHEPGDWAIIAPTYGDARDVCVEGPSGLIRALGSSVENWNRSIGELFVAGGHRVFIDGADDGALRIQGKNLRGAWCVAAGEMVTTDLGDFPIERIEAGDRVLTRQGWRRVTAAAFTGTKPTVRITTTTGQSVRLTADHLVWVAGRGWTKAGDVAPCDSMVVCQTTRSPARQPTSPSAASGSTGHGQATTKIAPATSSTTQYGSKPMGPSPEARSSTTSTATPPTTVSTTLRRSLGPNTWNTMRQRSRAIPDSSRPGNGQPQPYGRTASREKLCAPTAAAPTTQPGCEHGSAPTTAVRTSTVASVETCSSSDVYDLAVDGAHEFFAGGILIHNCDEVGLWRNPTRAWTESLQFAVRLSPGRIVATGTPKMGNVLVKDLLHDPSVVVTTMRTLDNAANLHPAAVAALFEKYEGTRLGRQELEGEFLEDIPGALWTADLIERSRLAPDADLPTFDRVVVAVDPSGSRDEDVGTSETGIVVAGFARHTGHGYVLADMSLHGSPDEWGRAVVAGFDMFEADLVVAERNFGGEMVRTVLQTTRRGLPVRLVNASRGKAVRAEPVAVLYDQGKVHHVGVFARLEEQMTGWVPDAGMDSPDRMDALVWALTDLMVGAPADMAVIPKTGWSEPVVRRGDLVLVGDQYVDKAR